MPEIITKTIGIDGDYPDDVAWKTAMLAQYPNLITADVIVRALFLDRISLDKGHWLIGFITDEEHYVWLDVHPQAQHYGIVGQGFRINYTSVNEAGIDGCDLRVSNMEIIINDATDGIRAEQSTWVENCLIHGASGNYAITAIHGALGNLKAYKNIIFEPITLSPSTSYNGITPNDNEADIKIYNNIIYAPINQGILASGNRTGNVYNNIVINTGKQYGYYAGSFFFGENVNHDHNISDDTKATGSKSITGAKAEDIWEKYKNYRFKISENGIAYKAGYDASDLFITDIVGRKFISGFWDIGALAHEYISLSMHKEIFEHIKNAILNYSDLNFKYVERADWIDREGNYPKGLVGNSFTIFIEAENRPEIQDEEFESDKYNELSVNVLFCLDSIHDNWLDNITHCREALKLVITTAYENFLLNKTKPYYTTELTPDNKLVIVNFDNLFFHIN